MTDDSTGRGQHPRPLIDAYTHCPLCGSVEYGAGNPGRKCRTCGHHEFNNPVAAAGAFIADGAGRVLLIRRANEPAKGALMAPGGFLDGGESLEVAVRREVAEEVGLTVESLEFLGSYPNQYLFDGFLRVTVDCMFAATVVEPDPETTARIDPAEATAIEWLDPAQVDPNDLAFDSIRRGFAAFRVYLSGRALP